MSDESRAEKFARLRDGRLTKALDAMSVLSNLSSTKHYDYTEEEARDIVEALQGRLDELATAFGVERPDSGGADSPDPAPRAPAGDDRSGTIDLGALRSSVCEVDGRLMRVAPGDWSGIDLIHVGPTLGLALEAAMDRDCETTVALLCEAMRA